MYLWSEDYSIRTNILDISLKQNSLIHHQTSRGAGTLLLPDLPGEQKSRFHLWWSIKYCFVFTCEPVTQLWMIQHFSCPSVRLIKHTKKLMDNEEKLCIKILQTLREMLDKKECFQEAVSTSTCMGSMSQKHGFNYTISHFYKENFCSTRKWYYSLTVTWNNVWIR